MIQIAKPVSKSSVQIGADARGCLRCNGKKLKALPPKTKLGDTENAFAGGFALWEARAGHA
jgi:hypothetical protein